MDYDVSGIESEKAQADMTRLLRVIGEYGLHIHLTQKDQPSDARGRMIELITSAMPTPLGRSNPQEITVHRNGHCDGAPFCSFTARYTPDGLVVTGISPNATSIELMSRAGIPIPMRAVDGVSGAGNWFDTPEAEQAYQASVRGKFMEGMRMLSKVLRDISDHTERERAMLLQLGSKNLVGSASGVDAAVDWSLIHKMAVNTAHDITAQLTNMTAITARLEGLSKVVTPIPHNTVRITNAFDTMEGFAGDD